MKHNFIALPKALPQKFIDSLQGVKGFDEEAFLQVHTSGEQVTSIRYNPEKSEIRNLKSEMQIVPWCPYGRYLNERPSFTLDPLFHAGVYYVQEASSMFLWEVLKHTVGEKTKGLKVLDLCAAPGGKSSLLASYFTNGLVVANEVIKPRAAVLVENISKWGSDNVVVTNNDARDFKKLAGYFDVIVIDAPCSGSGLFRKDVNATGEWSEENVLLSTQRQQRILADVYTALKQGGVLIYSTCSYSVEEDEEILDWLMDNYQLSTVDYKVPEKWGVVEVASSKHKAVGYRFYPYKLKGEGFFIAAFIKKDGEYFDEQKLSPAQASKQEAALIKPWLKQEKPLAFIKQKETIITIPETLQNDVALLQKHLYLKKAGVAVGTIKGKDMVPHHELALSLLVNEAISKAELNKEQALQYLRKKDVTINNLTKGWMLANYEGANLGWMKVLHNRVNNYYPVEWRILKV